MRLRLTIVLKIRIIMRLEVPQMNKQNETKTTKTPQQEPKQEPMTGVIVDGEVFPFLMTCKEHDEYLKYLETRKQSKE